MKEEDREKLKQWTRRRKADRQCHFVRGREGVGGLALKEVGSRGWQGEGRVAKSFITPSFPILLPVLFIHGDS